jgi:hypothetical protein
MYIWIYWMPFWPIETQLVGIAEPSSILAQAALILPKLIFLSQYNISP